MIPGEYVLRSEEIEINKGKEAVTVCISNTGDRPVQVGSHFHFFEVNRELVFDRKRTFGMRLDIPAGTAVRFEPGQDKEVRLVPFGGRRAVYGLNSLTDGAMDEGSIRGAALQKARDKGFGGA
jgi:urease beta subunit